MTLCKYGCLLGIFFIIIYLSVRYFFFFLRSQNAKKGVEIMSFKKKKKIHKLYL